MASPEGPRGAMRPEDRRAMLDRAREQSMVLERFTRRRLGDSGSEAKPVQAPESRLAGHVPLTPSVDGSADHASKVVRGVSIAPLGNPQVPIEGQF